MTELAVVVLAAGMGTRMKSDLPKVLHKVAGRSLLGHVLHSAKELHANKVVVVHGPGHDDVKKASSKIISDCLFAEQAERKGTGHAVMMAEAQLAGGSGTVLVIYGDVPLIKPEALQNLLSKLSPQFPMAVLGFNAINPFGYGRLLERGNVVTAIREQKDASEEERTITLCNSGIIAISARDLWPTLKKLKPANAQGEFYLTDVVELLA